MITKLTAENSGLYYAPAFALINQALEAAGKSLRIHSIEDYFNNLTTDIIPLLVNQHENADGTVSGIPGGYLLLMPADEEIFAIDANTRAISIPSKVKKNGVGVYGDHRAEMLVLSIDRYFDNQDLLNTNVAINWNFTPLGAKYPLYDTPKAVPAFAPNADLDPEKVTFGFIIDKDMTPSKGVLTFSVTFYTTKSNDIDYSLNTLPAMVNINDTLTLLDPTIIHDDIDNFLGRFTNSVYQDNTISPVGNPIWKSGTLEDGVYSGLDKIAYFSTTEDLNNEYNNGALLKAYAVTNPNTADITYKWTVKPLDGTVAMGRDFNTVNLASDYIEVEIPDNDNNELYYMEDANSGKIDVTKPPLTWAEAKAIVDDNNDSNIKPYLNIRIKKLDAENVPTDPNFDHDSSEFNQENIAVNVIDNMISLTSKEDLFSFPSTNAAQGEGKWVALDIYLDRPIEGLRWNGGLLTQDDVNEAASVGLGIGHIIFWVKADAINSAARTITISDPSGEYKDTQFKVQYNGIQNYDGIDSYATIVNKGNAPKFFVRGTSYRALMAGNYQVSAQARISAGNYYNEVLENAELKAGVNYYKEVNGEIDSLNPLINEEALAAQAANIKLYVLASASRNSEVVDSSVLVIPAALRPVVSLRMESEFNFDEATTKDEDFDGPEYVYIDSEQLPVVVATVAIDSTDPRDAAGAFAVELIKSDAEPLTKEAIENGNYEFAVLSDGNFTFRPQTIEEGEYLVRAINRRNGTYSVSDPTVTEKIHTSFVAPEVRTLTVEGAIWDKDAARPESGFETVLTDGEKPNNTLINLEINRLHPRYTFNIHDNTVIDGTKYKIDDIHTSYYVEEVEYDEKTGIVTPRTPDAEGNDPETGRPYEYYGNPDLEIIDNSTGNLIFTIDNDPGYYRIKTVTRYHGTTHISYTDIFGIVSH